MVSERVKIDHVLRISVLILFILVIGFVAIYALTYVLPLSDNMFYQALYTLVLVVLGLAVPYWMLKVAIHVAHLRNSKERELKLEDIPKDQQQLEEEGNK